MKFKNFEKDCQYFTKDIEKDIINNSFDDSKNIKNMNTTYFLFLSSKILTSKIFQSQYYLKN